MKILLKTPDLSIQDLSIQDFWFFELENNFPNTEKVEESIFIAKYKDSSHFNDWISAQLEDSSGHMYILFMKELNKVLTRTKIKEAFCEIKNGGWRGLHGITPTFKLTAQSLLNSISLDGEASLEFNKKGQQLSITRYSHDEPTGATILLHSKKHYDRIYNEVFNPQ